MAAIAGALGFNLLSYGQQVADLHDARSWSVASAIDLRIGGRVPMPPFPSGLAGAADDALSGAVSAGLLRPPRPLEPEQVRALRDLPAGRFAPGPAMRCEASESVAGYIIEPVGDPSGGDGRPDYGVVLEDGSPLVLPVDVRRSRIPDYISRGSFLSDHYSIVIPNNCHLPGNHALYGIRLSPHGMITVLWQTAVRVP
jgi:hypothetical protein